MRPGFANPLALTYTTSCQGFDVNIWPWNCSTDLNDNDRNISVCCQKCRRKYIHVTQCGSTASVYIEIAVALFLFSLSKFQSFHLVVERASKITSIQKLFCDVRCAKHLNKCMIPH